MTVKSVRASPETSSEHDAQHYRLYITSGSPASSRAVVNARSFFEKHLPGRHRLEVLEISTHVAAARLDQIVASPTLVRISPLPIRRFIGDLSNSDQLWSTLRLPQPQPAG